MSVDYGFVLTEAILELRIFQEKILTKKNVISKGLECNCKRIILDEYLIAVSNLMMAIANFSQLIEEIKDEETLQYRFSFVCKQYRKTISCRLFQNDQVEPKLLALFQTVYADIEQRILNNIKNRFLTLVGVEEPNGLRMKICKENLDDLYDLIEHLVLSLSGIQIDCKLLKNEIFSDPNVDKYIKSCKIDINTLISNSSVCCNLQNDDNIIHLFITNEVYEIPDWFNHLTEIYRKYYENSKNIKIVLDYKLAEPFIWDIDHEKNYLQMSSVFKTVDFVNCPHIDFGEYIQNKNIVSI